MRAIKVSTWAGAGGGGALAMWLFVLLLQPRKREFRVSGSRLVTSPKEFQRGLDEATDGIRLHPGVRISRERESRHLLVVGATGTGKTQVINYLMRSALDAGDAAIVYDFKGDLTSSYLDDEAALLAPWDARGWALAVARDITSPEHARTLAEALMPDIGSEAMWVSASRIIATAVFRSCMARKPGTWTFADALDRFNSSEESLCALVREFAPEGLRLVEDARSRTTQSILITLAAHLSPIESLNKAWEGIPPERTLSVGEWLETGSPRVVILQGNGQLLPLAVASQDAVFRVLLAAVASPTLSESRDRRRWIFGDEFLQLGKLAQLVPLLQVARSKGVRFVLAAQDVPGVRSVYGPDGADAILGTAGTTIVTGTHCAVTREWASRLAGTETIERLETSRSFARGGNSESERWTETTRPLVRPEDITARLGQVRRGKSMVTRALVVGARSTVGLLDWPRFELPHVTASHIPAPWLLQPNVASAPESGEAPVLPVEPALQADASTDQEDVVGDEGGDPPRRRLIVRKRGE
jgi:hypothetical protein